MHRVVSGQAITVTKQEVVMTSAAHQHDQHECDEHEHHADEPNHVHDPHECDEHEHHADGS